MGSHVGVESLNSYVNNVRFFGWRLEWWEADDVHAERKKRVASFHISSLTLVLMIWKMSPLICFESVQKLLRFVSLVDEDRIKKLLSEFKEKNISPAVCFRFVFFIVDQSGYRVHFRRWRRRQSLEDVCLFNSRPAFGGSKTRIWDSLRTFSLLWRLCEAVLRIGKAK